MSRVTQKMGYVSPLGRKSLFVESEESSRQTPNYKYIWRGVYFYNKLFSDLRNGNIFTYNHVHYLAGQKTQLTIDKRFKKFILGNDSQYYLPTWYIDKLNQKPFDLGQNKIYLDGFISPYQKKVDPTKVEFNTSVFLRKRTKGLMIKEDIYDGFAKYRMLFPFEDYQQNKSLQENYAIIIETENYNEFEAILRYLNISPPESFITEIKDKFGYAFRQAKEPQLLEFLYNRAPQFVLQEINYIQRWIDLFTLLSHFVRNSKEKAILNILESLAIDRSLMEKESDKRKFTDKVNHFFQILSIHNGSTSIFEKLYNKLNDYGVGSDNFTALIQMLYKFWLLSDYSDPEYHLNKKEYTGGPEVLIYNEKKILGFYKDKHSFEFVKTKTRLKIEVLEDKPKGYSIGTRIYSAIFLDDKKIGTYNLFHPITLADTPKEGELKVPPTNVFPAFFLKALDDKKYWANVEKEIWIGVDLVTTALGVGNLLKLRHLRHLAKLKNVGTLFKLKTTASFVEVTSGTLNILLTLADSKSELAEKLRTYLFWLEMASLGVDVITERLLKKAAREALEKADNLTDARVIAHLSEVVGASAQFARRVKKVLDDAPDVIKNYEKRIKNFEKEFGKVYNKNTKLDEIYTSNLPDRIDWPDRILFRLKQAILTHNHPKGAGISIDDIKFLFANRLKEIRAVGPDGSVFSFKNTGFKVKEMDEIVERIEQIEKKYYLAKKFSVQSTKVVDYREFKEIFDLIKDKVEYVHYVE